MRYPKNKWERFWFGCLMVALLAFVPMAVVFAVVRFVFWLMGGE